MPKPYNHLASFGKRQEYVAIAELLKRGFDVYQTLVDDKGIDCIIRRELEGQLSYLDIQIRARSGDAQSRSWGLWPSTRFVPRLNYFFIFYSEPLGRYWIIPSADLAERAYPHPQEGVTNTYNVNLARERRQRGKIEHVNTDEFAEYIDAWDLLEAR